MPRWEGQEKKTPPSPSTSTPPPGMILARDEFESIRSHYETINQCHVDPMTWSHLKDVEISQETEAAFKRSCNYYYGADASMHEEELQDDYDFGVTQYQDHSLFFWVAVERSDESMV